MEAVFSATPPIPGRLIQLSLQGCPLPPLAGLCLLGVLDEQPADKVLGQLAGIAEVLLIEVVVHGGDVSQGLLLGLPQEWGCTTQTERQTWGSDPLRSLHHQAAAWTTTELCEPMKGPHAEAGGLWDQPRDASIPLGPLTSHPPATMQSAVIAQLDKY